MPVIKKFVVTPYRRGNRNKLVAAEVREARTAEAAMRLAENMSDRFVGTIAHEMDIDDETGEMWFAALLARHGEAINFLEDQY
ncbi:hypothetical protein RHIZ_03045 [Rhizobium skierniewicense]|uniref:hypothetical protein n=1 Tax=Rhizobium skierniewicense TaxID=984260 RepID=UPI001FAC7352|nr:hypothetical protein [Rhizobium skierniewicense]MCI9864917.1 hypothetical protein [Rhizobium skierniewicense]